MFSKALSSCRVFANTASRQPEFRQAVCEVAKSLDKMKPSSVLPTHVPVFLNMKEPERLIKFKVNWRDDKGEMCTNQGFRVQFNSALGPYKGGLRFHPTVDESVLKFLGFEQILKNSLTGLWMGGGKGGSDFDPKGRSEAEIRRFCEAFMQCLGRHIGPNTDVPAGDIGVGGREIGYMYGQYRRDKNAHDGTLTGKGETWGGSPGRPQATGYGTVYFAQEMLKGCMGESGSLKNKRVAVSGSGNVAQFAAHKLIEEGAVVVSLSDSKGSLKFVDSEGLPLDMLKEIQESKLKGGALDSFASPGVSEFHAGKTPWRLLENVDIALPCATQNELDGGDASHLFDAGCRIVAEGANMPCTEDAVGIFENYGVHFAGGKMSNAGGVAVSGLEMAQNGARTQWAFPVVDAELKSIMSQVYAQAKEQSTLHGCSLTDGGNIAGFCRVHDAMIDQGMM